MILVQFLINIRKVRHEKHYDIRKVWTQNDLILSVLFCCVSWTPKTTSFGGDFQGDL